MILTLLFICFVMPLKFPYILTEKRKFSLSDYYFDQTNVKIYSIHSWQKNNCRLFQISWIPRQIMGWSNLALLLNMALITWLTRPLGIKASSLVCLVYYPVFAGFGFSFLTFSTWNIRLKFIGIHWNNIQHVEWSGRSREWKQPGTE